MGAGDAALELPAGDVDPLPEPPLPASTADASESDAAALHAAPASPADGLAPAAPPVGDDEDTASHGDAVRTSTELNREHSGWFGTRGSAGTDVLAGDVVPAELLARRMSRWLLHQLRASPRRCRRLSLKNCRCWHLLQNTGLQRHQALFTASHWPLQLRPSLQRRQRLTRTRCRCRRLQRRTSLQRRQALSATSCWLP